ncbi:XdhC/CoxF family protein [Agrobacterium larrymoorei]|uniref:XdhC family protein n=1 Tax=Agrobacterium larrymoorei TaxID=160699 RepID=UPI001573FFF4|nr:XdhC family protein [Agrobacterium larrymoorei]NTJ43838.1 XdhC/CoxF family protein [Agrobacterium larrymoorei]
MRRDNLQRLNEARRNRLPAALLTDISSGKERVFVGDDLAAEFDDGIGSAFRLGQSLLVETERGSSFLNVYVPTPRIVIIGAVHIGQFLTQMAMFTGFDVHVVDPRTAFATLQRFPGATLTPDWPLDHFANHPLDRYTALVALTHDPKIDDTPLAEALRARCFYIGALGSRKTHATRIDRLLQEGLDARTLSKIHAPIGLNIGADNPAEIAIAILAEIVQALHLQSSSMGMET